MSLFIYTFLLAPNLVSIHIFPQSYLLVSNVPVQQFELDNIFQDSYIYGFLEHGSRGLASKRAGDKKVTLQPRACR